MLRLFFSITDVLLVTLLEDPTLYNIGRPKEGVNGMDTWKDSDHTMIRRGDSGQRTGWNVLTDRRRRFEGLRWLQLWRGAKLH